MLARAFRGWLLIFLAWRAHERKGDARFDEIKGSFVRFMKAWIVQGMWVMLISMPGRPETLSRLVLRSALHPLLGCHDTLRQLRHRGHAGLWALHPHRDPVGHSEPGF